MECHFEEKLFLYVDGMLEGEELLEAERHVGGCPACREQMALLERLEGDFHADVALPDDFTQKVLGKLRSRPSPAEMLPAVGVAALFLAVFLLPGSASPLPLLGDVLSRLVTVLKGLHLQHLLSAMMRQNASFLGAYFSMMAMTAFVFQVWGRKRLQPSQAVNTRRR